MEVARITAIVTANTTGFLRGMAQVDAGVKRASAQMSGLAATSNRVGTRMASLGATLTKRVSLPALAVGAASVAMAADFETSMAKIQGLVGVGSADVQKLAADARRIGPAYGKSASEAADALFFITSAGIDAAAAGSVLEASAKASAVGLGDTATVADLATSAMNAYGSSTLPASKATDVMVAAVREGKLEATELAGSMGRVLPVASAMGVSFNEVGASFAALSRTGTNAAEAATQIRGILASILRPTKMAQETLSEYGMSAGDLRKQIREKGLLSVLKTLTTTFGDNEEAQARVFGNIRALSGVMDLMGKNTKNTEQIFKDMADVSGDLDAAFAVTSQTTAFKMSQAMEQIKGALSGLGAAIAPVVAGLASFIGSVGSAFGKLPGPVKTVAGALLGIVAVMGPLMLGVGKLTAMMTANAAATTAAGAAATRTAVQMSAMGTVAGGTAGKVGMFSGMVGRMGGPIGMAVGATVGLAAVMWNLRNPLSAVERQNASLAEAQKKVTDNQKAQAQAFTSSGQTVRSISAATKDVSAKSKELAEAQRTLTSLQSSGKATAEQLAKAERDVAVARAEVGVATAEQNALAGQSAQSVRDLMKAENDSTRALEEQRDALIQQTTGLAGAAAGSEELAKRKRELELVEADLALRQAEQPARLEKIRKHLVSQRDELKKSGSQTDATKDAIDAFNREIHRLDKQTKDAKTVKVKAKTASAGTAVSTIKTALENIDGKVFNVTLKAIKKNFNFGGFVPGFASGGTVRGPSGRDVIPAMLTAGEAVLTEKQQRLVNSGMTIGQAFRSTGVSGFAKGGLVQRRKGAAKLV
ncbi:phage tail tape measure protein [bacterium]|nr:phage tail tape measure protein [bacterium]